MTTLDAALAGADITNAAKAHTIRRHLSVVSNTSYATARINQGSFTYPITEITVDGTSADWLTAPLNATVLIGSTAGASDIAILRNRKATSASKVFVNEVSEGDAGLLPGGIRTAALADNLYVTIVSAYNFFSVLPLISGGTVYEDFERVPSTFNTNPGPLVYVVAGGEHNHIATYVDASQTYATIVFTASSTLWPTSSGVTYAWTAPASWGAPTAGATNTSTVTYHVPRSTTNYDLKLVVTEDSASNTQTRHVMVWVHERTGTYAPISISDMSGDGWEVGGARFDFTLGDNLLASIPSGTMVHIWDEAGFGDTTIASAVTRFTGWLVRVTKHGEPGLRSANCEFISPAGLLASRRGTSQIITAATSPTTWEEVPATLCTLSFLQWWLLKNRASNVLDLFDINVASTSPVGQRLPSIVVNAGNLWQQISTLADGWMKRVAGCDPDGVLWIGQPNPVVTYSYGNRGSIVKRDTLTESIISTYDLPREYVPQVGQVNGEAFSWTGTIGTLPTPYLSVAPGNAPGQGAGDQKVQNQVVTEQADINLVTGLTYAALNPDYGEGTITIAGNRGALYKPAQGQMVRLQIAAAYMPDGVAFDRYIIISRVSRSYERTGDGGSVVVNTQLSFTVETAGVDGVTVQVPIENNELYSTSSSFVWTPTLAALVPNDTGYLLRQVSTKALQPPAGKVAKFTGEELIVWEADSIWYLKNVITLTTPQATNIAPSNLPNGFENIQCAVDPFYVAATAIPAYDLISDLTDSQIGYCTNIAAATAADLWTWGDAASGVYDVIRATSVSGGVMIYSTGATDPCFGSPATTYNYVASDQSFLPCDSIGLPGARSQYTAGVGWQSVYIASANSTENRFYRAVTGNYTCAKIYVTADTASNVSISDGLETSIATIFGTQSMGAGTTVIEISGTLNFTDGIRIDVLPTTLGVHSSTVTKLELYNDTGTGAVVVYSSDHGATLGSPITVGDTPTGGVGGFDCQPSGTNSFAAADGIVARATTLGGAYSSYYTITGGVQAACIIVPWRTWSGADNTANANPDILVGLTGADGSSRTLLWLEGGATVGTLHDLTPVANFIFSNANSITSQYQHHIACIGSVSGTAKMRTTNDRGASWTDRGTITAPTWIRTSRKHNKGAMSGTNAGQLYTAKNGTLLYSSFWAGGGGSTNGCWPRNMPTSILGFDTIF